MLVALAEVSPAVVSGSALLDRVWPDVVVVPNVVYQAITQLRKRRGDVLGPCTTCSGTAEGKKRARIATARPFGSIERAL